MCQLFIFTVCAPPSSHLFLIKPPRTTLGHYEYHGRNQHTRTSSLLWYRRLRLSDGDSQPISHPDQLGQRTGSHLLHHLVAMNLTVVSLVPSSAPICLLS